MTHRFGIFLSVIGFLLFIIFAVTFQSGEANLLIGFSAAFCLVIGIFLAIRFRPGAVAATRFRTFNKFRDMGSRQKKQ
jgi:hypothetical protein